MITISVDDQVNTAKEIVTMMKEIDPDGEHSAYSNAEECKGASKGICGLPCTGTAGRGKISRKAE